jgi:hypothetical protein
MRNYSKTVGALAVASFMVGHAGAEIEGQIGAGYNTDYIFRGALYGTDLVDTSVDVSWEAGGVAFNAGAWYGSVQKDPLIGEVNYDELDLYAEASKEVLTGLTGRVGWNYYDRETPLGIANEDSSEVYFGLSRELPFAGISADLTYFWDVNGDNDGYLELGLGKHIAINDCWSLDLGSKLGYLVEEGGLSHLTAKAALNYRLTENAVVSGYVAHVWELDELESSVESFASEGNRLFGGVGVRVGF